MQRLIIECDNVCCKAEVFLTGDRVKFMHVAEYRKKINSSVQKSELRSVSHSNNVGILTGRALYDTTGKEL